MSIEVLQRADEPFFTTKEVGKGMGLGRLFVARALIERASGSFVTHSSIGSGAKVVVCLPSERGANRDGQVAADCRR